VPTDQYSPEARARLARLIEQERQRQGKSKKELGGGSWDTYQNLIKGLKVWDKTLRNVERVLGLAEFACDDVLAGAATLRRARPGEQPDPEAAITARVNVAHGQIFEGLAGATPEEIFQVAEYLADARARARQSRAK